jgi:hypothetical protein
MVSTPTGNWLVFTAKLAIAVPPEPANETEPSKVFPELKLTAPEGVPAPPEALTVAVNWRVPPQANVLGMPVNVVVVLAGSRGPKKNTGTSRDHVFPVASTPLNPKMWVAGTVRVFRSPIYQFLMERRLKPAA